jgi:nicotinamidase-related amidase
MPAVPALLIIDAQVNMFDPANPVAGADGLLARLIELQARARAAQALVVAVRNCGGENDPDQRGSIGWQIHPGLDSADLVLDKTTCDTFASTALGEELARRGVRQVVIAGLQSEFCIRETALGALAQGLEVTLVADGHSTYDGKSSAARETTAAVNGELSPRVRLVSASDVRFG